MFNSNNTKVIKSEDYLTSTYQNLKLLLETERGELTCDPYFGVLLKHYMFNQNNYVLKDMIVDMLYNQIALFIPQLHVERNDITVVQNSKEKSKLYITIYGINQIDFQPNTYTLALSINENTLK